jgi:TonB-linked SusC/RagA family outer membrane protein
MIKYLIVLSVSLSISFSLFAQTRTIKGNVVDETGKPAGNVNVTVKENKNEIVQTDNDGNFSIKIKESGAFSLVLSASGIESKIVNVYSNADLKIKVKHAITTQDEVVVIGYGETVKRKYLNTTVSTVDKTQLKDVPLNSAAEALTGRLAGVQITSDEGEPGSDATINIRGKTSVTQDGSPLYIIDGVRVEDGLNSISPMDIDNVVVLKDASATALYGASGANGVILITTKSGKNLKGKTSISYNGFVGFSELPKELGVMNPYNFVAYQWERDTYTSPQDSAIIQGYATNWDSVAKYKNYHGVDWQHTVMGRKAFQQSHSVNFSGGNDKTTFSLSLSANQQDGIIIQTGYQRYLASFRLDQVISPKAKVGFSVRYNNSEKIGKGTSDPGSSSLNNLRQSIRYSPIAGSANYYDPSVFLETNGNSLALINPYLLQYQQYQMIYGDLVNLSGYFSFNITKDITFKTTAGYEIYTQRTNNFNDTITIPIFLQSISRTCLNTWIKNMISMFF